MTTQVVLEQLLHDRLVLITCQVRRNPPHLCNRGYYVRDHTTYMVYQLGSTAFARLTLSSAISRSLSCTTTWR